MKLDVISTKTLQKFDSVVLNFSEIESEKFSFNPFKLRENVYQKTIIRFFDIDECVKQISLFPNLFVSCQINKADIEITLGTNVFFVLNNKENTGWIKNLQKAQRAFSTYEDKIKVDLYYLLFVIFAAIISVPIITTNYQTMKDNEVKQILVLNRLKEAEKNDSIRLDINHKNHIKESIYKASPEFLIDKKARIIQLRKDSLLALRPQKTEVLDEEKIYRKKTAELRRKYLGFLYNYPNSLKFNSEFGKPETLDGTNSKKWITYFSKGTITVIINKKTNKIENICFGYNSILE